MAKRRKIPKKVDTKDYRHSGEKRKNIPLAKIAAEGNVPKVKKAKYYYSPHLSPELRYDPTGKTDKLMAVREKVEQYLTNDERDVLKNAIDNNQPWLEWAGKKEEHDKECFEVDPVALHIHERVSAQAIVRTAMREDPQRDLFADPQLDYQEAIKFYQHDVDWANRLILGDSLQVMSSLARRENLAGKVQMMYIDPPYGIKFSSNWQNEVGKRDVKAKEKDHTREPEVIKAYRDTWELGVHSYLSYLRDRLVVSRELLSQTGSMFIQIGEENVHKVRALCDEILGEGNYVSQLSVRKTTTPRKFIDNNLFYILWYAKDYPQLKYRQVFLSKNVKEWTSETKGGSWGALINNIFQKLSPVQKNDPTTLPQGSLVYQLTDLASDGASSKEVLFNFHGEEIPPRAKCHWKTTPKGLSRLDKAERVEERGGRPWFRKFHGDFPCKRMTNVWDDTSGKTNERLYVVQTQDKVIQRCILMSSDPGDLVLDPTCGSGITACLAEKWGRRWITIDTSRVAIAIARQRLLTISHEFYRLRDDIKGVAGNFHYKTVPHLTLKDIAQNQNLDPIFDKYEPLLLQALDDCNHALEKVTDKVRVELQAKLKTKQDREGKRAITDADIRRWALPKNGTKWEQWKVPFDADRLWPNDLQDAVAAYRDTWRVKMEEINTCIATNSDQEELVDLPDIVKGILRVSGPFTVEGVRPEELSLGEEGLFDGTPNEWEEDGISDIADEVQNIRAYLSRMVELIRKDGVTFPNNQHQKFARVDPLFEEGTGSELHAESVWEGADEDEPNNIAIAFGPQYGPVTSQQVGDMIRASRRYDELVIAGFSFDATAMDTIQENQHPKLKIHMAHIRPDVSPGMDGLLKDTPNSQLFTVFGQPEVEVRSAGDGGIQVELQGVDIYDPLKGEVKSTGASKVAAWFLDGDYDGRCFCITQAFFPDQKAWDKIAKALGSSADAEAFDAFKGTVSVPFKPGKHQRIAVKVIDPRGNEVMAIASLKDIN